MSNGATQRSITRRMMPMHRAVFHALRIHRMRMKNPNSNPLVPWIVSAPGAGKTEMIWHYSKGLGLSFVACEPGLERSEKFGGIPDLYRIKNSLGKEELVTEWSVPELIHKLRRASEENSNGVVCLLDDWHLCDEDVQAIGFELFTHYSLNGHKVPRNVSFILAGNDSSAAGAKIQFSAIRNRATIMYGIPDVEFWLTNYAIPLNVHPTVTGFFSDLQNKIYFHTDESTVDQFASPRSWTQGVSDNLKDLEISTQNGLEGVDENELGCIIEGSVGRQAGQKFLEFVLYYREINLEDIFDKGIVKLPDALLEKFAYAIAVSNELYRRKAIDPNDNNAGNSYAKVLKILINENQELAVKSLFHICHKMKDEKEGLPSGVEIVINMAKNGEIPAQTLEKLPKISAIMNKGKK